MKISKDLLKHSLLGGFGASTITLGTLYGTSLSKEEEQGDDPSVIDPMVLQTQGAGTNEYVEDNINALKQIAKLNHEKKGMQKTLRTVNQDLTETKNELAQLKQELNQTKNYLAEELEEKEFNENGITQLEKNEVQFLKKIEDLKKEKEISESIIKDLEGELTQTQRQAENLRTKLSEVNDPEFVETLKRMVIDRKEADDILFGGMYKEIKRLNSKDGTIGVAEQSEIGLIQYLRDLVKEKEGKINDLMRSAEELLGEVVAANKKLDEGKDQVRDAKKDKDKIEDLNNQLETYKSLIKKYDEERNTLSKKLDGLKSVQQELAVLKVTLSTQTPNNPDICTKDESDPSTIKCDSLFFYNPKTEGGGNGIKKIIIEKKPER